MEHLNIGALSDSELEFIRDQITKELELRERQIDQYRIDVQEMLDEIVKDEHCTVHLHIVSENYGFETVSITPETKYVIEVEKAD